MNPSSLVKYYAFLPLHIYRRSRDHQGGHEIVSTNSSSKQNHETRKTWKSVDKTVLG